MQQTLYESHQIMVERGKMTDGLEQAYLEFCQAISVVFEEKREQFRMDDVMVKIPLNQWAQVYFSHIEEFYTKRSAH
ncbi:MAG: hypothetical protein UU98_C0018G0012 [Parcubacteria group bacterium GW2011_GWD2_42_14]|nr:MAG: hypothetical protein UU98_C0018G0012 [Parcubacteria group bacterium GW2011_GWD2_42_14]